MNSQDSVVKMFWFSVDSNDSFSSNLNMVVEPGQDMATTFPTSNHGGGGHHSNSEAGSAQATSRGGYLGSAAAANAHNPLFMPRKFLLMYLTRALQII